MKNYKIPVRVEAIAYVHIAGKDLNDAYMKAMDSKSFSKIEGDVVVSRDSIPVVDDARLKKLYPKEYTQMIDNEKPSWEKLGWEQIGETYIKDNARIVNTFDDVGWGFQGTVWIGDVGVKGFHSLDEAINYAEEKMK